MNLSRRLLAAVRDSRIPLVATVLSGILTGLLIIGQAAGLSRVVDGVFLRGLVLSDVVGILWILGLIIFLRALLAWLSEVSAKAVAVRIKSDLRQRLFDKILSLGPAYTRHERTGELVNTAVEGVDALDAYFSQYLPQVVIAALVPLSILIVVFPRDALSGFVLLLTAPLIPIFMYLIGKTAELLTRRQWDTLSRLSAHFLDSLQGLTTLKELGRSKEHGKSIAETSDRFRDVTLSVLRVTFLSALVLELVATLSTALVAVEVSLRVLNGHIAFQQAFFLLLLAPEFYLPLRLLGLRFHAGMSGTTAARRIFEILDLPVSSDPGSAGRNLDHHSLFFPPGSLISIRDLSFKYPGETVPALRDVSMDIHSGEHIALVGKSGAGKSTLAAILLRFIHPASGQITMDGKPFLEIPLDAWRGLVAWVPQDPYLFHDTISANLRLAQPDASDEQLMTASRAAHLDDFIHSLPQGLGTIVGEGGARLSSGQAQRLALARAFLKNAPILVLDEPTSSLDPGQEMLVDAAVHDLMLERTVITIAHRLTTVFQADRIFVLEQGCLVEQGTHRELLMQGGGYSRLVNSAGQPMDLIDSPKLPNAILEAVSTANEDILVDPRDSHPRSSILRLLGFLRYSWGWVLLSVLLGVITIGSNVGLMVTSAYLVSAAALHPQLGTLMVAIAAVRFFGIGRGVFRYAERLASHSVTFRLLARLRLWFYKALEPLAPARIMQYRSGDLLSRIVADVDNLDGFYVRVVAPPLVAMVVVVSMVFFLGWYDLKLAWVYLAFNFVLGIGVSLLSWTLSQSSATGLVSKRAALQARWVGGILGLADLLVFGHEVEYSESLQRDGQACDQAQRHLAFLNGFSSALSILLVNLGMLAILGLAIPLVVVGQVSPVMLAALTMSALAGFEAVVPLPLAAQTLASSLQSARRLFELVDAKPNVQDPLSARRLPFTDSPGSLDLNITNLSFCYPGQSRPALQEISFHLTLGKQIAIVGPSGAGKTSLTNILLRFWDYSQGLIRLDGCELHDIAQEDVRRWFGYISQRTFFFYGTIRQNLLLARPEATEIEIVRAAKLARIHEFIAGLPEGYETVIGERGFRLSGGERQRVAIARALLKNAPVFLFDEPTANLDPITERQILDVLLTMTNDHSLLLITHRLVRLENMDEILVLDQGRVVERGTHASLLAGRGLYRYMWDFQNRILSEKIEA
jgi:ATP-binding cassette subfamily C protein CydCD